MIYIRGDHLRAEVLRAYIYRNTVENANHPARLLWLSLFGKDDSVPTTDVEWLADHAFAVTVKGELDQRARSARPALLAEAAP